MEEYKVGDEVRFALNGKAKIVDVNVDDTYELGYIALDDIDGSPVIDFVPPECLVLIEPEFKPNQVYADKHGNRWLVDADRWLIGIGGTANPNNPKHDRPSGLRLVLDVVA